MLGNTFTPLFSFFLFLREEEWVCVNYYKEQYVKCTTIFSDLPRSSHTQLQQCLLINEIILPKTKGNFLLVHLAATVALKKKKKMCKRQWFTSKKLKDQRVVNHSVFTVALNLLNHIKRVFQNQRHGVFCTIMSKPPTIIYKQSAGTEAWNRNQSSYHVYWQKQECYGVIVIALPSWVVLKETAREKLPPISIYLLRIIVSIQYLFHSRVHWLHLYSLWWVANWAAPVA